MATRKRKSGLWLAVFTVLAAVAGWGIGTFARQSTKSAVVNSFVGQALHGTAPKQVFEDVDQITFLVLGCDRDYTKGGKRVTKQAARSDMMMVVRADFKNQMIRGVSIPRDMVVPIPGKWSDKINAAHAYGGPDLAKKTVENTLDVKIDRVIVLNFDAFKSMIDLVGGVDVDVERNMKYRDRAGGLNIDLKKGMQTLDGEDAMGYVRYRHGDSDLVRQERQKHLMLSLKDKLIAHPLLVTEVADQTIELFGNALNAEEVAAMIRFAKGLPPEKIKLGQVPVVDTSTKTAYTQAIDSAKLREVMEDVGLWESTSPKTKELS
jgi:LCP family protein required for cell wall assembly